MAAGAGDAAALGAAGAWFDLKIKFVAWEAENKERCGAGMGVTSWGVENRQRTTDNGQREAAVTAREANGRAFKWALAVALQPSGRGIRTGTDCILRAFRSKTSNSPRRAPSRSRDSSGRLRPYGRRPSSGILTRDGAGWIQRAQNSFSRVVAHVQARSCSIAKMKPARATSRHGLELYRLNLSIDLFQGRGVFAAR